MGVYFHNGRQALSLRGLPGWGGLGAAESPAEAYGPDSDISPELTEDLAASGGGGADALLAQSSQVLARGAKGPQVVELQAQLIGRGIPLDTSSGGWGTFGPRTEAAVKAFQVSRGLKPTGVVNAQTWAAFNRPAIRPSEPSVVAQPRERPRRPSKAGFRKIVEAHRRKMARREDGNRGDGDGPMVPAGPKPAKWPWVVGIVAVLGIFTYAIVASRPDKPKAKPKLTSQDFPPLPT